MDLSEIRELARLMHEEKISRLEYESGEVSIKLERGDARVSSDGVTSPAVAYLSAEDTGGALGTPISHTTPASATPDAAHLPNPGDARQTDDLGRDFNDMSVVTSPLVGVFYAAPAEGQAPYVQVGDKVKEGDILCIVEAMKTMNEITATADGEVVDICVRNGDVAEFGQPLFKLI